VEKDWLAYGHLFAERLGTPTYTGIHIVPSSESLVLQMGSVSTSPVRGAPGSAFTSAGSHSPAALSSNYSPIFLQVRLRASFSDSNNVLDAILCELG
jgi:myotubularin-related protein 1/2